MIYDVLETEEIYLLLKMDEGYQVVLDVIEGCDTMGWQYTNHLCKLVEVAKLPPRFNGEKLIHYNGGTYVLVFDWTSNSISIPRRSVWLDKGWETFNLEDIPDIDGPLYVVEGTNEQEALFTYRFSEHPE